MKKIYTIATATLLATAIIQSAYASTPKPSFKGVEFKASKEVLCTTGQSVTYKNETNESKLEGEFTTAYIWTFEGGTPKTFLGENPPAIVYNSTGTFKTTLLGKASNKNGEILGKEEKALIIVVQNPIINLGADKSLCAGNATTLDAGTGFSKYRWTNGQNNGKLGDEATLVVNTNGTYKITAETPLGCEASDEINVTSAICTGIENEAAIANVNIFPNPAKDIVNVTANFEKASDLKIIIVNTRGIIVYANNMTSATVVNLPINISNLSAGLYRVNYFVDGNLAKSTSLMVQ